MNKGIWLLVTHDKYELPIMVADTALEMAERLGITETSIHSSRSHAKKDGRWTPYRRVDLEGDDDD